MTDKQVTQADREAAASVWYPIKGGQTFGRFTERGDMDSDPRVQAFASHRIASTAKLEAERDELIEAGRLLRERLAAFVGAVADVTDCRKDVDAITAFDTLLGEPK